MNIIYILTSLALIISYLLLNKSEKKENLIHSVIISVILFLTYNIFITQVVFCTFKINIIKFSNC